MHNDDIILFTEKKQSKSCLSWYESKAFFELDKHIQSDVLDKYGLPYLVLRLTETLYFYSLIS